MWFAAGNVDGMSAMIKMQARVQWLNQNIGVINMNRWYRGVFRVVCF